MPIVVAAFAAVALLAVLLLSWPLLLVLRYRAGTARRPLRPWVLTVNLVSLFVSAIVFMVSAAFTNIWVPGALRDTGLGLLAGFALGLVGVLVTRWEASGPLVHYTPSRVMVLAITLLVAVRVAYGIWRAWHAWHVTAATPWIARAGVQGSMAAGAVVLGYYLAYVLGLRVRLRRHLAS
jgi:hypothetical protein